MIVVVFQRGSVDHLMEMNETDGTMDIECTRLDCTKGFFCKE